MFGVVVRYMFVYKHKRTHTDKDYLLIVVQDPTQQ